MASLQLAADRGFFGLWLPVVLVAAYSCGTYGAGSYGTCSSVGVPNTGFAPLAALQSMVTNNYFLLGLLFLVLLGVGLLVMFMARRSGR